MRNNAAQIKWVNTQVTITTAYKTAHFCGKTKS